MPHAQQVGSSPRKELTPRRQPWNPPIVGPACLPPSVRLQSSETSMQLAQSLVNNMVVSQRALDEDLRSIDTTYASILTSAPGAKQTVWLSRYYTRNSGASTTTTQKVSTPRSAAASTSQHAPSASCDANGDEGDLSSTANTNVVLRATATTTDETSSHRSSPRKREAATPKKHLAPQHSPPNHGSTTSYRTHEGDEEHALAPQTLAASLSLPNPTTGHLRRSSFVGGLTPRAQQRLADASAGAGHHNHWGHGGKKGGASGETFVPSAYPDKMNWLHFDRNSENERVAKRQEALAPVSTTVTTGPSTSISTRKGVTAAVAPLHPLTGTHEELLRHCAAALDGAIADVTYRCEGHFLEQGGHEESWTFPLDQEVELLYALGASQFLHHHHPDTEAVADAEPHAAAALITLPPSPQDMIDVRHLGAFLQSENVCSCDITTTSTTYVTIRHKANDGSVTTAHRTTFKKLRAALKAYSVLAPAAVAVSSSNAPAAADADRADVPPLSGEDTTPPPEGAPIVTDTATSGES